MVYSENNIKSNDITRCNQVLSDLGYYIGHDGGSDIYPTLKIYKKVLTDTSYDLVLIDNIQFQMEFKIGHKNRMEFILGNIDLSEMTNIFLFEESTPSLEKTKIDPKLANVSVDDADFTLFISGRFSDIIGYLVVLLRVFDLSKLIWGIDGSGNEIFLPKYRIGEMVSPVREKFEMKIIGYSMDSYGNLLFKCIGLSDKFPHVISQFHEESLKHSRLNKIDQILKNN